MYDVSAGLTCPNCGAPVTSEICPYCGCPTGLDSSQANMEYPTLDCKEAVLNFWTVLFPLLFTFTFGVGGIAMLVTGIIELDTEPDAVMIILFSIPFTIIGAVALVIFLRPVINYIQIRLHGKHIEGTVYGYVDDNVLMNGRPAQVVKILVDTPNGKRFIMYQLGNTTQPYGINTTVGLWVYRDKFMIDKNREVINW